MSVFSSQHFFDVTKPDGMVPRLTNHRIIIFLPPPQILEFQSPCSLLQAFIVIYAK